MVQFAAAGSSTKANILPLELTMAVNIEAESARAGSRLPSWFDENRVQGHTRLVLGLFEAPPPPPASDDSARGRSRGTAAAPPASSTTPSATYATSRRDPPVGRQVLPIEYGPINLIVCNVAPLMRTYCRRPTRHDMEDGTCHSRT
jgi:hypothetical protein